jgi:glycosyltransferase 2 family protein
VKLLRRWIPIFISIVIIVVLLVLAPWGEIYNSLSELRAKSIIALLLLSLAYYSLKTIRFWYLLRAMSVDKPFSLVALSYMSAQPISLLPAGEIFRSHSLRRYAGVPVEKSIGQFTLQGLFEGSAMALLMLISALALGTLRLPAIALSLVLIAILLAIRAGYLSEAGKMINRLPYINVTEQRIEQFSKRNRQALSWPWLPLLFGLSLTIELVGSTIAYISVISIGGELNIFQAALLYVVPIILGFVSLLPGGFGVSESSAVGILYLSNAPIAIAAAATLIMRVTIVGLGVIYGLAALVLANAKHQKRPVLEV